MSEPYRWAPRCTCEVPMLGTVDGDQEAVFCANCEGLIDRFERITINRLNNMHKANTQPPKGSDKDLMNTLDSWLLSRGVDKS